MILKWSVGKDWRHRSFTSYVKSNCLQHFKITSWRFVFSSLHFVTITWSHTGMRSRSWDYLRPNARKFVVIKLPLMLAQLLWLQHLSRALEVCPLICKLAYAAWWQFVLVTYILHHITPQFRRQSAAAQVSHSSMGEKCALLLKLTAFTSMRSITSRRVCY